MVEKQKHIVLFIHSLEKGGAERVMSNLAKVLVSHGMRVTLLTQYREEDEYSVPESVTRVYSEITAEEKTGSRVGDFKARYKKLRRIFLDLNPDCVLSFVGKNNLMAIAATRRTGIPVVVSVRGEPKSEYYNPLLRLCAKLLFPMAEGIIFQLEGAKSYFSNAVGRKSVILRNPLNASFVRPRYEGERDGRIISVGSFTENKNHKMMMMAFAGIAQEFPNTRLVFYGEGECRQSLEALAEKLEISDRVEMPGVTGDVADKIYTASVFLMASGSEGMPNALIEAMCMGLPSISTDCPCGGPAELICHGENGFLVPVGDVKAMENCLRMLLADNFLSEQVSRRAAEMLEKFKPEKVNQEWVNYLLSKCR